MDNSDTILALAALAQTTRLDAFRLLVAHAPSGLAAGELAGRLAVPQNTLSAHLAVLSRAGLVRGARQGRSIVYHADLDRMAATILFLVGDCCGGRPDLCIPLVDALSPCCVGKADCYV